MNIPDPVDAVILWVDGNDPAHSEKRKKYLPAAEPDHLDCAIHEYRFLDTGELKYCVFSIRKFAPWIRNIYIISDEQHPEWLSPEVSQKLNVSVVDHKIIFEGYHEYLPTFNNLTILSMAWKIPGLAEKYVLFNDDTFLIEETSRHDFFDGDRIVLRGRWKPVKPGAIKILRKFARQILDTGKIGRVKIVKDYVHINGASLAGFRDRYFETFHIPLPMKVSVQKEFYEKHDDLLRDNIKYRFRNRNQFGPGVLFTHLEFKNGRVKVRNGDDTMIIIPRPGGLKDNRIKFNKIRVSGGIKFLCFQDLVYLLKENTSEYEEVTVFLKERLLF